MSAPAAELQGHLLTPQGWVRGQLRHAHGRIVAVVGEPVDERTVGPSSLPRLLPGFIDLHVHGGGGHDTMGGGDAALQMARTHARHGTTSLLATTMTAPRDEIEAALRALAPFVTTRPRGDGPARGDVHEDERVRIAQAPFRDDPVPQEVARPQGLGVGLDELVPGRLAALRTGRQPCIL